MIKKRHFLFSISYKFIVISVGFSIIGIHYLVGQVWFSRNAQLKIVSNALQKGGVDVKNDQGVTGLMFASDQGFYERAQVFIDFGAHVNEHGDRYGMTPLHYAVYNADNSQSFDVAKLLMESHADTRAHAQFPQRPVHKIHPWHLLINIDDEGMYKKLGSLLVSNGADVNAQSAKGYTLMHLAVEINDEDRVRWTLHQFGSFIDLSKTMKVKVPNGYKNMTPQQYAQFLRFEDVLGVFDEARIEVAGYPETQLEEPEEVRERDPNGFDALMVGVIRNDEMQVKRLLSWGAQVNSQTKDEYRKSPLQIAVLHRLPSMVRILLDAGADIGYVNAKGNTVLHLLPRVYDVQIQQEIFDILTENDVRKNMMAKIINNQNYRRDTVAHIAVAVNDVDLMKRLIKDFAYQIDTELINDRRATPKQLAQRWKRHSLIPLFDKLRRVKLQSPHRQAFFASRYAPCARFSQS